LEFHLLECPPMSSCYRDDIWHVHHEGHLHAVLWHDGTSPSEGALITRGYTRRILLV
jgi:hypothetical protein